MCRKLLCLVALLSFASIAQALVIDDFESYMDDTELRAVWTQDVPIATPYLMTTGACEQYQAMDVDYMVPGGWAQPGNPTNYDTLNHSSVMRTWGPVDFQATDLIKMCVQVEAGWDLAKANYVLIEWTGDKWGQTWLSCQGQLNPWWAPYPEYPAVFVNDNWVNPGNIAGIGPGTKIIRPSSGWVEVTIDNGDCVPWGATLESFAALNGIHLQLWGAWIDKSGASGGPKIDGTDTVWPNGPLEGSVDYDYIRYIPEPATIAMLGLGGLALIRRKK